MGCQACPCCFIQLLCKSPSALLQWLTRGTDLITLTPQPASCRPLTGGQRSSKFHQNAAPTQPVSRPNWNELSSMADCVIYPLFRFPFAARRSGRHGIPGVCSAVNGSRGSELLIAGDPISQCLRVSLFGISIVGAQCFLGDSSLVYFP